MEMALEVVKCHPRFWGTIFGNFGERIERIKIVVDGYCFGQQLSTTIFHFNFYKITENQRENKLTLNPCLLVFWKTLASLNPNFPELYPLFTES